MWTLKPSRHHTLLTLDPCWQLKNDIVLDESSHYQVSVQLEVVRVCYPCQEIGYPIFDSLSSRLIMSPEPVLGELILVYWLYPVEGIFLWVGRYHPVLGLPPFDRLIEASKQLVLF